MSSLILPRRFTQQPQYNAKASYDGLVHAWTIDVKGSRAVIDSAGNADGVFGTGTGGTSGNSWVIDSLGKSIQFSNAGTGSVTSVDLALGDSSGNASPNSQIFTLFTRLYLGGGGAYQTLYAGGSQSVNLRVSSSNKIEILKAGVALIGASSTALSTGRWYTVAVTYDGATARFYLDGVPDGTGSSSQTFTFASQHYFGVYFSGERVSNGLKLQNFYVLNRILSASEIRALTDNPWQIFKHRPQVLYFDVGGSGTQTLTPSLLTNTNTFYSPTIGRGAVTLTPSLFTSATNAFYSATVTQGGATQTLTPSLFSNSQSFYSATVTPGGVSLAPPLLTNGQTFYAPTVTPGSVTLTPSLFTSSTNAFYAPTVTQEGGPQYLTVPLVSNTNAFYAPTVTPGAITITPDLFANAQTFYSATVSQGAPGQTLEPELFVSTNQFFTAIVTVGGVTLTPSLFTNSNTFYAHLLTGGDTVNAILSAPRSAGRQIQTGIRSNIQNTRR